MHSSRWACKGALGVLLFAATAWGQVQELPVIGQIGGGSRTISVSGNYAFLGDGPKIDILDISNPSSPMLVGQYVVPAGLFVADVYATGGRIYVATGKMVVGYATLLIVVDVTDPSNPVEMGSHSMFGNAHGVFVSGRYAYIASRSPLPGGGGIPGSSGLRIVDISNPSSPIEVGFWPSVGQVYCVYVAGSYAFVGGDHYPTSTTGTLRIIDISDPSNPVEVGFRDVPAQVSGITVVGSHAYLASYNAGLRIIDVENPNDPVEIGSLLLGIASDVSVDGNLAYVSNDTGGLLIIDVTDNANPIEAGFYLTGARAYSAAIFDGHAYVADESGLRVVDVSNPSSPIGIGAFSTPGAPQDVFVVGDKAYTASGGAGLHVIDVSEPRLPKEIAFLDVPGDMLRDVFLSGNYAYTIAGGGWLRVIDISNSTNLIEVGSCFTSSYPYEVVAAGSYVYIASVDVGLQVFDVAVPANPVEVGFFDAPGANGVFVEGNYAYIAQQQSGPTNVQGTVLILDISDPTAIAEVGAYIVPNNAFFGVYVLGNYAYVAASQLRILDVSNPTSPSEISILGLATGGPRGVLVSGRYAYVASHGGGLSVVDVTNPSTPIEVANSIVIGHAFGLSLRNFAYVAGEVGGGLSIVAVPPPAPSVDALPRFINGNTLTVTGAAVAGSFVTAGGGLIPVFQQLEEGATAFSIDVPLRQEADNVLSVTTMNEFGLVSLPAIRVIHEGDAFPATVESVTALAITPAPAPDVSVNGTLAFAAEATFSDSSTAFVTEFLEVPIGAGVTDGGGWEELVNGELITAGGLYVNTKTGAAQIRANVTQTNGPQVFSNVVTVNDGAKTEGGKADMGVIAGRVSDELTGQGLGLPEEIARVLGFAPYSSTLLAQTQVLQPTGDYAFLLNEGNYDFQGTSANYRPLLVRAGQAISGVPGAYTGHIDDARPLEQDFALRREDFEPPLVTFIEPVPGQVVGAPEVGITAIVFDELSELTTAELIVNGEASNILPAISLEGFYRNVWPMQPGANTVRIRAVDSEGNETLTPEISTTSSFVPLELTAAVPVSRTQIQVSFNGDVPGDDALDPAHYRVVNASQVPLTVTAVTRLSLTEFLLTTAQQTPGATYTVSVWGINDEFGFLVRVSVTEEFVGTSVTPADSDGDGMPNDWETANGTNPAVNDASADPDADGLANLQEFNRRTLPLDADTDNDALNDGPEVNTHNTDPLRFDTDRDLMPDGWEVAHGLNPLVIDATSDLDGDRLSNITEYRLGTDPSDTDSDNDGLSDGREHNIYGTDPLVADTDGDGLSDGAEIAAGYNPLQDSRVRVDLRPVVQGVVVRVGVKREGAAVELLQVGQAVRVGVRGGVVDSRVRPVRCLPVVWHAVAVTVRGSD